MIGPQNPPFKLSEQVNDRDLYKLMTQLPTVEVLAKLKSLPPYTESLIRQSLISIYSYVTERDYVENTDTFFMHVCGTVFYESHQQVLIKDKDHAKKAGNTLSMVRANLEELKAKLQNYPFSNAQQKETLQLFIKLLESHALLFVFALQNISEDKKEHLKKFQGLDVEAGTSTVLSPTKKAAIKIAYPSTPQTSPQKKPTTPTKLSAANKESLNELVPPAKRVRKIQDALFKKSPQSSQDDEPKSLEHSSGSEESYELQEKLGGWLDYEPEPTKDSAFDDLLSEQMDALLHFTRLPHSLSFQAPDGPLAPAMSSLKRQAKK